ncbi:MAG: hypothetical protein RLZZ480_5 [Candidatus Parcubacteria bacterium]|jgi:prepilin-type N-terminal cleavage/methylation domain-containing protein
MKSTRGFSLIEIVTVISIMGVILSAVLFKITGIRQHGRDAERMSDLRELQSAIELYKQRYGRYPEGCNGPDTWSGQLGTDYACNRNNGIYAAYVGTGQYIIGHQAGITFAPGFISVLPTDPKLKDALSGYVYTTNSAGTVYKLMARRTVESEVVTYSNKFKSCDATNPGTKVTCTADTQPKDPVTDTTCDVGMCDRVMASPYSGTKPTHCTESDSTFQTTYAVWGGYATAGTDLDVARQTENITCAIP